MKTCARSPVGIQSEWGWDGWVEVGRPAAVMDSSEGKGPDEAPLSSSKSERRSAEKRERAMKYPLDGKKTSAAAVHPLEAHLR